MIRVENIDVYGFEAAIRGMRNPMNSWERSDSCWCGYIEQDCENDDNKCMNLCGLGKPTNCFAVGKNDIDLMRKLAKAGTEHRKYLRMITVTMDITAPLYWWKEFDTYKVGTVANSCSTMHKIHAKEFTLDDFSCEHLIDGVVGTDELYNPYKHFCNTISCLNQCRNAYLKTKNKTRWWQMIQLLPSSYNQKRTVQMNYEVVFNIIRQRSNHKLDEWLQFVDTLKELPYVKELMQ